MRPARAMSRAVAIASVTVAISAAVALALAPSRLPVREAVQWITQVTGAAMTRDPRMEASPESPFENTPAPGTFCPRQLRAGAAQSRPDDGAPAGTLLDSSALQLLGGSDSRISDLSTGANCTPPSGASAQLRQRQFP